MELQERHPSGTTETEHDVSNELANGLETPFQNEVPPHSILANVRIDRDSSYFKRLEHWWLQNINLVVLHTSHAPTGGDPRDYLALERTYLGWLRTSTAVVSCGIIIAQLFILKHVDPTKGSVLGALFSVTGMVTSFLGCFRYFRLQKKLVVGKAETGGWSIIIFWLLLISIVIALLVTVLVDTGELE